MRIAVWHNLPSGGGKRALYYHVRGLVERGHSVEAWCPPTADRSFLPLDQLVPEHVVPLAWEPKRLRGPVTRAWANYKNVVDKLAALDRHCRQCAEEIERGGFDILFANGDRDFAVSPIGRHVRLPRALYLQEPYRPLYEAMPQLPWLALPGPRRFSPTYLIRFLHNLVKAQGARTQAREEVLNAQAFDTILVNSQFSRESILRAYGLDASVCYLGVDLDLFHKHEVQRERFVLGLGSFTPAKGVRIVIEAINLMEKPRPRLVWVGNASQPDFLEEMKRLARALEVDLQPRLEVTDEELVDLLNRAGVLAYAPRLEPFGFAPIEANACGLPAVVVPEGGVRETVIDGVNGLWADHDAESVASALHRLLSDSDYAARLGEQGIQMAREKWSLDDAIDRLERRLLETIEKTRRERPGFRDSPRSYPSGGTDRE
ncbi:MAG TPA: glycosyltransferase family 4 protein [Chloroflexia bacterium]|nr:glycosyltransferase family 4 protein [Chloroflexia bacterium]